MDCKLVTFFYNAMHVGDDNSSILGTECPLRNETDDDTKPVSWPILRFPKHKMQRRFLAKLRSAILIYNFI